MISAEGYYAFCGGIVGACQLTSSLVYNCYNLGSVSISAANTKRLGGIAGSNGTSSSYPAGTIRNCYCTLDTEYLCWENSSSYISRPAVIMTKDSSILDLDLWIDDTYNLNDGYPILKWQLKVPIYAKVYLNDIGDKIEVAIPYSRYDIKEVRDENNNILNEVTKNKLYSINATSGKHKFKVIDKNGNTKILVLNIEIIRNTADLSNFRDNVNTGNDYKDWEVIQVADIDLSSVCGENVDTNEDGIGDTELSWTPIGATGKYFAGTYDGRYHTLSNLYINTDQYPHVGLFRRNKNTSIIKNLIIEKEYIINEYNSTDDATYSAGIISVNDGLIKNCAIIQSDINSKRTTNKNTAAGGLVGLNYGSITCCYNASKVTRNRV